MRYQLPPLSRHIRVLSAEESDRLDKLDPYLPKSLNECVTCKGRKRFNWWKDYGRSEEIVEYDCPCPEQFVLHKYLLNAGIPLALQRFCFGDIATTSNQAAEAMIEYVSDYQYFLAQGHGFTFHGGRGTGKTLLASLMIKILLDKGVDGYFTTFTDMLDSYAAGWRDDEQKNWFDQRIRSVPLLVIDDIGKEHQGRVGMSSIAIDNVFRYRVQAGKPTVMTTNMRPDQMRETYSDAMETVAGKSRFFSFTGPSWRNSHAEKDRHDAEMNLRLTRPITIR